jgi:hypothetical protein
METHISGTFFSLLIRVKYNSFPSEEIEGAYIRKLELFMLIKSLSDNTLLVKEELLFSAIPNFDSDNILFLK